MGKSTKQVVMVAETYRTGLRLHQDPDKDGTFGIMLVPGSAHKASVGAILVIRKTGKMSTVMYDGGQAFPLWEIVDNEEA